MNKLEKQNRLDNFKRAAIEYLKSLPNSFDNGTYSVSVMTIFGKLDIGIEAPIHDPDPEYYFVFCKFADPRWATKEWGTDAVNRYSGKWNHLFVIEEQTPEQVLDYFKSQLKRILLPVNTREHIEMLRLVVEAYVLEHGESMGTNLSLLNRRIDEAKALLG